MNLHNSMSYQQKMEIQWVQAKNLDLFFIGCVLIHVCRVISVCFHTQYQKLPFFWHIRWPDCTCHCNSMFIFQKKRFSSEFAFPEKCDELQIENPINNPNRPAPQPVLLISASGW